MGAARGDAKAAPTELFFSEYVEGSGNSKALEIYNGTGAPVDLNANGYAVFFSFNGGTSTRTIPLTGSVAPGDVYVIAQATADGAILAQADQTDTSTSWFNGDDFIALRKGGTTVDSSASWASIREPNGASAIRAPPTHDPAQTDDRIRRDERDERVQPGR